jgi:hypothetical protein
MAWYKTGTVSIVSGATSVSATGTTFASNARVGDGFRGPDGEWYEIVNIASDTVLGIYPAYAGATVSNSANYMIAPLQGYNKETADRLRAITDSFSDLFTDSMVDGGNVSLSGGAYPAVPDHTTLWKVSAAGTVSGTSYAVGDNLIYSKVIGSFYKVDNTDAVTSVSGRTGAITLTKVDVGLSNVDNTSDTNKPVSTATLTALNGKEPTITVLPIIKGGTGGNSQATARTGLGLGTAATSDVTTSQTAASGIVKVGDFGIGTAMTLAPGSNLNSIVDPGEYAFTSGAALVNAPTTGACFVSVIGRSAYPYQEFRNIYGKSIWTRSAKVANPTTAAADWNNWSPIFTGENIVGTVSQVSGVPTGSVIESGSNSNGRYIKFADGTMVCYKRLSLSLAIDVAAGNVFFSAATSGGSWAMPFVGPVVRQVHSWGGSWNTGSSTPSDGNNVGNFVLVRHATTASTTYSVDITGYGVWF